MAAFPRCRRGRRPSRAGAGTTGRERWFPYVWIAALRPPAWRTAYAARHLCRLVSWESAPGTHAGPGRATTRPLPLRL